MSDFMIATYASSDYISYLEKCVNGCTRFMNTRPVVYAFDNETAKAARKWGCKVEEIHGWTMERHLYSLEILRLSPNKWTVMIDADCWPLRCVDLTQRIAEMEKDSLDFMGDIGQLDLEYLFKTTNKEDMLFRLHDVLRTFPRFGSLWMHSANVAPLRSSYGKIVVGLPVLYGGFGIYRTSAFRGITYPNWIHSADIWLSMHAIENNFKCRKMGTFQFNREIDSCENFIHFSGVKDGTHSLMEEEYFRLLKGDDNEAVA